MSVNMIDVYLGLGSNQGDRESFLQRAVELIGERIGKVKKESSIIETKAWGKTDQPDFLNLVLAVETDLSPQSLLKVCQLIEDDLGRMRAEKWGPREIDIDILLYGELEVDEPDLKIPHPLMWEREFVMKPLIEIAPDINVDYPSIDK